MPEDLHHIALPPHRTWHRGGDRPVLALHCSLAHAGAWSGLAAGLDDVTITATDAPGHGRAEDWQPGTDMHSLATAQSIAMAESLGQGAAIDLMGHSFGGTVALRIAVERPDLVRSLTLVEPVIFAAGKAVDTAAYERFRTDHLGFAELVAVGDREAAAALFHSHWGSGERLSDLPERTRAYMVDRIHLIVAQNPALLDDAAGILRDGGLEAVDVPVLLIEGADSPAIIDAVHRALALRLPQATRLVVPKAGHMVAITHAASIAASVQAHLDAA
ncbi:alpha/beta fold hydrolase [Cypionkella sp.]|uniref:alpha/beta fold hydrolase n=1 Tax=Cypionkella sp. TaxID=2811411 RepID=UPI002AB99E12|nr:alpha/beta fold hydrolase [Cypionkella sp.]MDZ4394688.1 alpha/beta fold hydrolase [Cypionkella sp.]